MAVPVRSVVWSQGDPALNVEGGAAIVVHEIVIASIAGTDAVALSVPFWYADDSTLAFRLYHNGGQNKANEHISIPFVMDRGLRISAPALVLGSITIVYERLG